MVDNPGNNADWFVTFKPLYTLQPVKATRDKQLKLWVDLIIRYCREHNVTSIHPTTFPLFRNDAIDRQLSHDGIAAVVESMIATGTKPFPRTSFSSSFSRATCRFTFLLSFDPFFTSIRSR